MSTSVVTVVENSTNVTVQSTGVNVSIAESVASVILGTSGPQGPKGESGLAALSTHINSATPHPTYDDLPSLGLLFENGLI